MRTSRGIDLSDGEPQTFPAACPDGCPPEEAAFPNGEVFRIVKCDPPAPTDFESHRERGIERGVPCIACGLSVFANKADAQHYRDKYPALGSFIAQAALNSTHGRWLPSQKATNSHITWWPFRHLARNAIFRVVQ